MSKSDRAKKRAKGQECNQARSLGRNRKAGGRHPSGDIRQPTKRERRDDVLSVARMQPHRKGLPDARKEGQENVTVDFRSPLAGSLIGRLRISGEISPVQQSAAQRFAQVRACYLAAINAPKETASAIDLSGDVAGQLWSEPVSDEDRAKLDAAARKAWADAESVLDDASLVLFGYGGWRRLREIVRLACMEDRMSANDIGDLRSGLNVLARMWGLEKVRMW